MRVLALVFFLVSLTVEAKELPTRQIKIGSSKLTVEVADDDKERAKGLMYRKKLPPNRGMLFIFQDSRPRRFWMKNTFIPLSIGFFDSSKKLIRIVNMKPVTSILETSPPSYSSEQPAQYALEVNKGWFKKNKIKIGQKFEFVGK